MKLQNLFLTRSVLLVGGVAVSWTAVTQAFQRFYISEGTLFKIQDCAIPNPVTTPCFYGAIAFAIALVWSLMLWAHVSQKGERHIRWLLIGAVVFAWVNVTYEFTQYFGLTAGPAIGCTLATVPPWQTPCFMGAVFFSLSLWASTAIFRRLAK